MESNAFCPHCGTPIPLSASECPSCQEPVPAAKTVIGYAGLPDVDPSRESSMQPVPEARSSPHASREQAEVSPSRSVEHGQVSPMAHEPDWQARQRKRGGTMPIPQPSAQPTPPPIAFEGPPLSPAALDPVAAVPIVSIDAAAASATTPKDPAPEAFVYGQPAYQSALSSAGSDSAVLSPTDTRKGLVWRTVVGGAWVTEALFLVPMATWYVALHLLLMHEHGAANLHESAWMTFGVATGALVTALLLWLVGLSCLSGRGWPRVYAVLAAVVHGAWGITTITLFTRSYDSDSIRWLIAVCVGSVLVSFALAVLTLSGHKWIGQGPVNGHARAIPYPLWAGPLLLVSALVQLSRELWKLVLLFIEYNTYSRFSSAVREVYGGLPLFIVGMGGLVTAMLIIVVSIALMRRSRWAVALGGGTGLLLLLVNVAAGIVLLTTYGKVVRYGFSFTLLDMGAASMWHFPVWLSLIAALRFRFRLPAYLRDAPAKDSNGKRLSLLEILVPKQT